MLLQTVEQIMPLLQLLQQPAFCICQDQILTNRSAHLLAPASADGLMDWLGDTAVLYSAWDRQGGLELPLSLGGQAYSLSILPLADGTLFLMASSHADQNTGDSLAVAAQVLRLPLNELYILSQKLFGRLECHMDEAMRQQAAAINRQLYRILRISSNLADVEQLRSGRWCLRQRGLELAAFLEPLVTEARQLCREAGAVLEYTPPKKSVLFFGDRDLLERAFWNLISNAVKHGSKESPIRLWTDLHAQTILLSVRNGCQEADRDLLSAAFTRMEQRGVLPDPRWGVGLGLPLVRHIAQLHGGTVALTVSGDSVTVTMSLSSKGRSSELVLESPPPMDYSGGMRRSLVELADVLPANCYDPAGL